MAITAGKRVSLSSQHAPTHKRILSSPQNTHTNQWACQVLLNTVKVTPKEEHAGEVHSEAILPRSHSLKENSSADTLCF